MKLRLAGVVALSAALVAGLAAVPAGARPAATARAATPPAAAQPAATSLGSSAAQLVALARDRRQRGTVTGVVRGAAGLPLAGACVSAFPAAGAAQPVTARANDGGHFLLVDMNPGRYTLRFTDCAQPGRYLPRWSGPTGLAATARPLLVGGGRVTRLAPVLLRPVSPAAMLARPSAAQIARAAGEPGVTPANFGGISGRLTDTHGRAITNTCVEVHFPGGAFGLALSARGTYSTGRELPPGRYTVEFAALDCGAGSGNWAPRWYKNAATQAGATPVRVLAGKITRNISGRVVHGGIVSGTVTSRAGVKLSGVCIGLVDRAGDLVTFTESGHGGYRLSGLPAGRYRMLFEPGCGSPSRYLTQWWPNEPTEARARSFQVRLGHAVRGIDARLQVGGTISGTVRFARPAGRPLAGICVDAETGGIFSESDFSAATGRRGRYQVIGLPTGRYSVSFFPGCDNNGNYLDASYPHPVQATAGHSVTGINAVLQQGATISGTVTSATGRPLTNLGAEAFDPSNDSGSAACTSADGTFEITQLPPGHYDVEFGNFCGLAASYAPQFYPGQSDPGAAVPLTLRPGGHVTGIDAAMQPGSAIAGTVTSTTGRPQAQVCVAVESPGSGVTAAEAGFAEADTETGPRGRYQVADLAAGRYVIQFSECGAPAVADRFFGGRPGVLAGDVVDVGSGQTISVARTVMRPGGAISGDVRTTAGRQVPNTCQTVTSLRTGLPVAALIFSGPGGQYRVTGAAPGRYRVEFTGCGENFTTQWFRGRSSPARATAVRVTAGRTTGAVDGAVRQGGQITGRLTSAASGRPVANFCVLALAGPFEGFGTTGPRGNYTVNGLNTATYHLQFSNCLGAAATVAGEQAARSVHVMAGHTVRGVSAALPAGGSISGTVTAPSGRGDVCVAAGPLARGGLPDEVTPDHAGDYVLSGLPAGKYHVFFDTRGGCDGSPDGLVPQWYRGVATEAAATAVTVRAGQDTTGIDVSLATDGGLSGQVTAAAGGAALAGVCVRAVPVAAGRAASFAATAGGRYAMTGLIPGTYTVEFSSGCGATGYARQWWHDATSAARATIVTVRPGVITTGISAALTR
jgi:Carboxypeptidase regulatory-like domain